MQNSCCAKNLKLKGSEITDQINLFLKGNRNLTQIGISFGNDIISHGERCECVGVNGWLL